MQRITTKTIIKLKKPKLNAPILRELRERFSPRYFSSSFISDTQVQSLFEAARWTPSGYNHQPWFFYWTRKGSDSYEKIISCLSDKNRWAESAPVLIVSCFLSKCEHGTNRYARHDLGAAVMSLIIQAQSMNIYCRQMGLFNGLRLQQLLHVPKDCTPSVIIAVGRIGDYTKIGENLLARESQERKRKLVISKKI